MSKYETYIKTKECSKCKEQKPFLEFSRNIKSRDGMTYKCKACIKKDRKPTENERINHNIDRSPFRFGKY